MKVVKSKRLALGTNSLSYKGVNAEAPPEVWIADRSPVAGDYNGFIIGDIWINKLSAGSEEVWVHTNRISNVATWTLLGFSGGDVNTLTGNVGGIVGPDLSDNIDVLGIGVLTVTGTPGSNKLEISASGALSDSFPTDTGTATPAVGVLNVIGGTGIATSGSGNTITISSTGGSVGIESLSGDSGGKVFPDGANNLDVLGLGTIGVVGTPASNKLEISISGAVSDAFPTDSGTAIPSAGMLKVLGGTGINTSGSGNTVTVGLTPGALPLTITGDAGGAISPDNSDNIFLLGVGGVTVTGTPVSNKLEIAMPGAMSDSFPTDAGTATPVAGVLNVVGGAGISTSGAGNTVTVTATGGAGALTSWTPVLEFGGAAGATSYSTQTGYYSKFGSILYYNFEIILDGALTAATGSATITGLSDNAGAAGRSSATNLSTIDNNVPIGLVAPPIITKVTSASSDLELFYVATNTDVIPVDETLINSTTSITGNGFYFLD